MDVVSLLLAAGCPESAPGGTLPRRRGNGRGVSAAGSWLSRIRTRGNLAKEKGQWTWCLCCWQLVVQNPHPGEPCQGEGAMDVVSLLLAAGCPESAPGGTLPR